MEPLLINPSVAEAELLGAYRNQSPTVKVIQKNLQFLVNPVPFAS